MAANSGVNWDVVARLMSSAGQLPNSREGKMVVSVTGLLANAAGALRELAGPLQDGSELAKQEMDERLDSAQPNFHAYGLEQLRGHLAELKLAFETGDAAKVKSFFDLYTFN